MDELPQEVTNLGEGLSLFSAWENLRVNPVLWIFLLFLNALYTVIGVHLRDFGQNGACELNVNRTIGRVEHFDQEGLFWGLWSIYPIISIIIVWVQIVFHVVYCCNDDKTTQRQQQEDQGDQERQKARRAPNVVKIIHIVLVNSLVIISGSLYIAADNYFFLVDPDDQTQNPSTTRGFIAGSSLICSVIVVVIDQWFEHSLYKCLKTCKCVKETDSQPDKNENEKVIKIIKILYFWSPLAGLITIFDSLFISVVDEISGEDNVRSGFDCSNEIGFKGAIGFFSVICSVFFISSVVVVVSKNINKRKHLGDYSSYNWKWKSCCVNIGYIVYYLVMGIVFVITGLMFIAADNNWPWICLAKNDSNICYWVMVRVDILAVVTVISFLFLFSSAALSLFECYKKLHTVV